MSARKNTLVTQLSSSNTIKNQPFSLTTSFVTPATVVRNLDNCSYQINVTTTDSIGTFAVQASDDYYVNEANDSVVVNPGNWIPLTLTSAGGSVPVVSATDTNIMINLNQLPFYAIRLAYTSTTPGTGSCTVFITHKQIGG